MIETREKRSDITEFGYGPSRFKTLVISPIFILVFVSLIYNLSIDIYKSKVVEFGLFITCIGLVLSFACLVLFIAIFLRYGISKSQKHKRIKISSDALVGPKDLFVWYFEEKINLKDIVMINPKYVNGKLISLEITSDEKVIKIKDHFLESGVLDKIKNLLNEFTKNKNE